MARKPSKTKDDETEAEEVEEAEDNGAEEAAAEQPAEGPHTPPVSPQPARTIEEHGIGPRDPYPSKDDGEPSKRTNDRREKED